MANIITNRLAAMTDAERQAIGTAIQQLIDVLQPHLTDLNTEQRRELVKMGERSLGFVRKALEYVQQQPQYLPQFLSLEEFQRHWDIAQSFEQDYGRPLRDLLDRIDDTVEFAGSQAMNCALAVYESFKRAASLNVEGSAVVVEDLQARFPGRRAAPKAEPPKT